MSLTTTQVVLLNNFYKSQPALNEPGKPSAEAEFPLGDIIKSLETKSPATLAKVTTSATGEITVTGMTATGSAIVTPLADCGTDLFFSHAECGSGKITVQLKDITGAVSAADTLACGLLVIALS